MSDIPEDIMGKARDLSCEGCSCSEEEAASCEHMGSICWHQANSIARALMEAEARGAAKERERCARIVDDLADQHEAAQFQPNCGPVPIPRHKTAMNDLRNASAAIGEAKP